METDFLFYFNQRINPGLGSIIHISLSNNQTAYIQPQQLSPTNFLLKYFKTSQVLIKWFYTYSFLLFNKQDSMVIFCFVACLTVKKEIFVWKMKSNWLSVFILTLPRAFISYQRENNTHIYYCVSIREKMRIAFRFIFIFLWLRI